jgi:exosortase/archaeosortase family protein
MTDYDFVFPSIVAFFALICALERRQSLQLSFNGTGLAVNLSFLIAFLALSARFSDLSSANPNALFLTWATLAVLTIFSSLLVWLHPKQIIYHPQGVLIFPALTAGASVILGRRLFEPVLAPATRLTGQMACAVLSPLLSNFSCGTDVFVNGDGPYQMLNHSLHTVAIGFGCGGMEGVFFFLFTSTLLVLNLNDKLSVLNSISFVFLGSIGVYLVNVLRICIYYTITLGVGAIAGNTASVATLRVLFHNALGWVLYAAFVYIYLRLWNKVLDGELSLQRAT